MRRHDLAYVSPGALIRFQCGAAAPDLAARVSDWIGQGRPLVVARQAAAGEDLLLGLTLPASAGRRRIGCLLRRDDVLRVRRPLGIAACLHCLPDAVATVLASLEAQLQESGIPVGVYGSLAWEALSGERYRHAESDVDLICDVASAEQLVRCLEALTAAQRLLPCGLDGEIRFPNGCAVAWKELAAAVGTPDAQVLVKGEAEVVLTSVAVLVEQFNEEPCDA